MAQRPTDQALIMDILAVIAERKIQQAIDNGELDVPSLHGIPIEIREDFSLPWEVRYRLTQLGRGKRNPASPTDLQLRLLARRRGRKPATTS